jgi:hypothetical protein
MVAEIPLVAIIKSSDAGGRIDPQPGHLLACQTRRNANPIIFAER